MSDSRGDGSFPSLWSIFNAHAITLLFRHEGLPKNFNDIRNVNVYDAPGAKGGDWKQYLKDKGEAWIITPLHYLSGTGSRPIRIASGGGRWNGHGKQPLKNNLDAYCEKRNYRLEGTGVLIPTYTMFEYLPAQDKPTHALCRISVDNMNIANSQQREGKEIDHTDSNNRDKRKTSQSQESKQQGGNYQNTTADYNQLIVERTLRELRKHHSYDDIRKLLDQIESEKLPAASTKKHSTEAPVSNTTHGRCTYMNTMEAGTSTKWQEQAKVEMFESKTYQEKPTNLRCDTNRNCLEKNDEEDRIYWEQQLLSSCNTDGCFKWDDIRSDKNCMQLDSELAELIANVQEPNQLSHNFNANSTVAMDYQNRIEPYPSTGNFATTEGRLDHQEPKLYPNINGNSTEPVLNNDHLLSCNQNISGPGPSTSNYAAFMGGSDEQEFEQNVQDPCNFNANLTEPTENGRYLPFYYAPTVPPITDQGTYNAIEDQQFALCNTQHGQIMFESDAYVLEPNNSSYYFKTISTEPTDKGNHLPIDNQNTIAPGLDTNNNATTEPKDMDWINNMDLSD